MKILYVEDNDDNVYMLKNRLDARRLHRHHCHGRGAGRRHGGGRAARPHSDGPEPAGLDGWEATRRIKAAPGDAAIPVIALTAHAMAGDREKALAAGCDDFDTKPVELPRLLGKIRALAPDGTRVVSRCDAALLVVDDIEDNRFTLTPPPRARGLH